MRDPHVDTRIHALDLVKRLDTVHHQADVWVDGAQQIAPFDGQRRLGPDGLVPNLDTELVILITQR